MKTAYLFSFNSWQYSPPQYILVYAMNEEEAREIGSKNCFFHSGTKAKPKDLNLVTYGL